MADAFSVSVIIPAYNEATRIANAIAAIRRQTEPPLEIVVVDDGSKDDTAAIARSLGAIVVVQSNGGISAARNAGIRESSGTWLAFCDADDTWHPEMLAAVRAAHEARSNVDFIFADHRTEIGGTITMPSMFAANPQFRSAAAESVLPGVLYFERHALAHALARQNCVAPSTAVIRHDLVLERGLFFEPKLPSTEEFHVPEDIEWYLRVLKATDALAIDRVMLTYSRHVDSVSANAGRVSYGVVKLGEIVEASPERYVDGLAAAFSKQRRHHVKTAATDDLRSFRFAGARKRLAEAQRIRFVPADQLLIVLALAGELPGAAGAGRALQRAWRSRKQR